MFSCGGREWGGGCRLRVGVSVRGFRVGGVGFRAWGSGSKVFGWFQVWRASLGHRSLRLTIFLWATITMMLVASTLLPMAVPI